MMFLDHLTKVRIVVIIYTFLIYDIRKKIKSAQKFNGEIKFSENDPVGVYGHALVLTNKLIIISSDGQRLFVLS